MRILIRDVRLAQNIKLRQLAETSGVSKSHLSRIETGESDPTLNTLVKIAKALKVKPSALINYGDPWWDE
jgi:transcriptional regulator with XRE-family HTH domain